jgi:hypothetical protein
MMCAPTPLDLGLETISLSDVIASLRSIPFEASMIALSVAAAEIYHHGRDAERQLALATDYHDRDMVCRIERFLAEDPLVHLVFDPRHVLALQRLMIVHGGNSTRALTEPDLHQLTRALVELGGALPTSEPEDQEDGAIDSEGWTRYFAQAGAWYHEPYILEAIARGYTMFAEIGEEGGIAPEAQHLEIDERLRDSYGLGLAEQIGAGVACAALTHAVNSDVPLAKRATSLEPGFLSAGRLAEREQEAIALLSSTRDEMRTELLAVGDGPEDVAWDHSVLEKSPFLRTASGQLRLSSPRLLVSWMTRGLHYRLLDASSRGLTGAQARRARGRFLTFTGGLGEEYVRRLVRRSLRIPERAGTLRIHGAVEFHVSKQRHDGPDVVIDAGPDLIMVEVYSGRMSRRARTTAGSDALIDFVNRSTAVKLSELTLRIKDFLAERLRYDAVHVRDVHRIWPVLVLAGDGVTQSPLLWDHLREMASEVFMDDARVQRPVICDLDDFEPLLALGEEGHHLPDLLASFLASSDCDQPPRNWVSRTYGLERRPSFVAGQFITAMNAARDRLFSGAAQGNGQATASADA